MVEKLQQFLRTSAGQIGLVAFVLVAAGMLFYSVRGFGRSDAAAATSERPFIDAETGKTFAYKIKMGDTFPVVSPFTGKRTGYHAEACYWTRDGKIKKEPTYVLLNKYKNKSGPTFCPDCGRLVREMNDPPIEGAPPPPTEEEYKASHAKYVEDQ